MKSTMEILTGAKDIIFDIPGALAIHAPASAPNLIRAFGLMHEMTHADDLRAWVRHATREQIEGAFDKAIAAEVRAHK